MKILTEEQRRAFRERVNEIYPEVRCRELNLNSSLRLWWKTREEDIRAVMLEIDRDQMRSASSLPTLWIR